MFCSEEVDAVAKRLKLKLFRTSVKEDFNVNQGNYKIITEPDYITVPMYVVFEYLASKYLDRRARELNKSRKVNTVSVG